MTLDVEEIREILATHYDLPFEKTESLAEWTASLNENFFKAQVLRDEHIRSRSFAILTTEVLETLVSLLKDSRVADVGCGTGYLSYHLLSNGVNVTPIDNRSSHYRIEDSPIDDKVVKSNYNDIDVSNFDTFIISWPNYASNEIEAFVARLPRGSRVIYQGEGIGGCTGTDRFHEILETEYTPDDIAVTLNDRHIRFNGIHDRWYVYIKD